MKKIVIGALALLLIGCPTVGDIGMPNDGGGGSAVEDFQFDPFGHGGAGGEGGSESENVCSDLEQCMDFCVSDFRDCKDNCNGKGCSRYCKDVKMECKNWCNENC